jgi:hypothetical protein
MQFDPETVKYLSGEKFSEAVLLKISQSEKNIPMRIEYLEELVSGKDVIHLGCADHISLIESKLKNNSWLHKRLEQKAKNCIGFDIDNDAVNFINQLGFRNVFSLNIIRDEVPEIIKQKYWDFLLLGEILEHTINPVEFLSSIREKYLKYINKIIITVPYAFRLNNFINTLKHSEYINSDHKFWFTPYTLAKLLYISNYQVESFQICLSYKISKSHLFRKFLLSKYPALRDNLVMIAKL